MKKKILVHIAILLILTGGFCNVYIKGLSVSSCGNQLSAFAADDTYSWESVSKDDLVTAFKYYCKSRNLAIEGSVADAVTSFTTSTFNNICNTLGIDPTQLQAELKKTTGGNLGLRFLFTQTGVNAYNRIFAEFLQNNDLQEGDSVDDKVVYSSKYFTDDDGNSCSIYITDLAISGSVGLNRYGISASNITQIGTYLKYPNSTFNSEGTYNVSFTVNGNVISRNVSTNYNLGSRIGSGQLGTSVGDQYYTFYSSTSPTNYLNNCISVLYSTDSNKYQICSISLINNSKDYYNNSYSINSLGVISNASNKVQDVDVTVNTPNNTVINNNTYNNNYTIIYNDGDYYDYDDDDEPDPSTPPGGGGGGGGDDPDPDEPPIVDPTPTPDPTVPDWDIELPEMPVGNEWLLYGLEKKFPWDIPFNLMYMLSLFAADPETPHFQGTLDLKVVQWDYDIDLAPFDDIARNVRNFEFVGFIIGLMLLTRKLIWG